MHIRFYKLFNSIRIYSKTVALKSVTVFTFYNANKFIRKCRFSFSNYAFLLSKPYNKNISA